MEEKDWELAVTYGLSEIPHIYEMNFEEEGGALLYLSLDHMLAPNIFVELYTALENAGGEWLADVQVWEFQKEYPEEA